ncbi:MAG: TlpA disulfide reductase family protein [Desulforhabdus sp.]|nr:TlpA disulfide reductase family protein [Desulforhabdus sp.]
MRKTYVIILLAILVGSYARLDYVLAVTEPPAEGGKLPEIILPVPENSEEKKYLGLDEDGSFKISQIKAEIVVIEIFSMYCPHCQKEAPVVNELYEAIQKRSDLKDKIKIIGIGGGNTAFEIKLFKNRYKIPFTLFPDADFTIHRLLGEVRTPYFVVVQMNRDRSHQVIYSRLGGFGDPDTFLQFILENSSLRKEDS